MISKKNPESLQDLCEPTTGLEPVTSSLPRKHSTAELSRRKKKSHSVRFVIFLSGRRGSNPRHSAWKADALPTELLPHFVSKKVGKRECKLKIIFLNLQINIKSGESRIRTYVAEAAELQSAPFDRSGISPVFFIIEPPEGFEPTTPRLQITCSGQLSYGGK